MKGVHSMQLNNPEEHGPHDWACFFENQSWYPGHPQRSGRLMHNIVGGMQWLRMHMERQGILDFEMPALRLTVPQTDDYDAEAALFHHQGEVFIDSLRLADASMLIPGTVIHLKDEEGNSIFHGSANEKFFLGGLEEGHHADFHRKNPDHFQKNPSLNPANVTGAEYDAQEHEFRAMETQLIAAELLGMTHQVIAVLRKRIEAACRLRS